MQELVEEHKDIQSERDAALTAVKKLQQVQRQQGNVADRYDNLSAKYASQGDKLADVQKQLAVRSEELRLLQEREATSQKQIKFAMDKRTVSSCTGMLQAGRSFAVLWAFGYFVLQVHIDPSHALADRRGAQPRA